MSGKIYTRSGDYGETSIFGGGRIKKKSPLMDACGSLDELSSFIGVCKSFSEDDYELRALLKEVQHDLYAIAGHIAGSGDEFDGSRTEYLEKVIDRFSDKLPKLSSFLLPGGTKLASFLHVSRAVCRRAERKLTIVYENESKFLNELKYLNRLSDLLFILARYVNVKSNEKEELVH